MHWTEDQHNRACSCADGSPWGNIAGEHVPRDQLWLFKTVHPDCKGCVMGKHRHMDVFAILVYHPEMRELLKGGA